MNKQATILGKAFLHSYMLPLQKEHIFNHFYNSPIMCFMHYLPLELEYTIYYLSPDSYRYVLSTLFMYAGYVEPCLIN